MINLPRESWERAVLSYQVKVLKAMDRTQLLEALRLSIRAVRNPRSLAPEYDEAARFEGRPVWSTVLIMDEDNLLGGHLVALRYLFYLIKLTLPWGTNFGYPKGMGDTHKANVRFSYASLSCMGARKLVEKAHHALHVMIYRFDNRPHAARDDPEWVHVKIDGTPTQPVLTDFDAYLYLLQLLENRIAREGL
ncbi:hypothetical protein DOMOVOI_01380 [Brevundimonas phage vB_BpoS-Domovoi]|uniref:Uncharacterized protein n=1 Tax=Brevundimonas phage vB_BpoS-Domovoi TaxID=2948598 RepID=A0A9E7MR75_9CAUD|nr:hypothetical protein DOMOVOI_01380 [Brevundimonas phage vB_BpoS-Domovoi]